MKEQLKPKLTYANVVATIALFIALGGGAYAAGNLAKNSVGTKQLKNNAVKRDKLAGNAVVSSKVAPGSLLSSDFKSGQVPAGPTGPAGPAGATGPSIGPAGGDLSGSFPNPQIGAGAVGPAETAEAPAAAVRETGSTIATSNSTIVSFVEEVRDTNGMFDPGQPDRLTVQTAGWYVVTGIVAWDPMAIGIRRVRLNVPFNNALIHGNLAAETVDAVSTESTRQVVTAVKYLDVGNTIGLRVYQDSGAFLDIGDGSFPSPQLTAVWIAP